MKLVIVESPSKVKKLSSYLGSGYTVTASVGHIRDLPKSNKTAIDIENGFVPRYVVSPGKEDVIANIQKLAKKAETVYLATDPDREGEAIAWHIAESANLKHPKRITFHEITKDAILDAIAHPRAIDTNLRRAQEARRVLDRLVGYDLSGVIWKKVRYGLSAGRVQSPALRIIVEREREIKAFIPETYWVLQAKTKTLGGAELLVTATEEPRSRDVVEKILKAAQTKNWQVAGIQESKVSRSARAPFITSTLQQVASTRLGYSPSKTMSIAQKLYEAGAITYMRTDSTTLSKVAIAQAATVIKSMFGAQYHAENTFAAKSKNAQEAHEAIRPTDLSKLSAGFTDEQKSLYKLIWQRTIASQMADASIMRTKIVARIEGAAETPDFTANGNRILFDGWLKADPDAQGEEVTLPKVAEGEKLTLLSITDIEKQTEPPSRYTEAGLVHELEKRGIGRPSTYASIINTIIEREYVTKEGKTLFPTDTGEVVSTFLEENFPTYISDTFTAEMEDKLDHIAHGEKDYEKTLSEFYKPFLKEVKSKEKLEKATHLGDADPKFKCPTCGKHMVIKLGRNGKFLSCADYPDCTGALMLDGTEIKKDEPLGFDPATNLPIFVLVGKYGPYVQLGTRAEKTASKAEKAIKPKMASIPRGVEIASVTLADALKFLSLPRVLGEHPETHKTITANNGRFGPYVVHDGDFRSLKKDDVYTIELKRALEIFSEPKAVRKGRFARKAPKKE